MALVNIPRSRTLASNPTYSADLWYDAPKLRRNLWLIPKPTAICVGLRVFSLAV